MSTSYTVESSNGVNYKLIVCDEIRKKREEEDKKKREKDERKREENERKKKENEILIQRLNLDYKSYPIEIKHYGHIQTLEEVNDSNPVYIYSFLQYILYAYNLHKPLVINMNVVNNAILDVISVMVEKCCKELKLKFVNHEGKKNLEIIDTEQNILLAYLKKISNDTTSEILDIINNFSLSTTTPCDKMCYDLSLLSMFGNYYNYILTSCGIPGLLFTDDRESIIKSKNLIKSIMDYLKINNCDVIEWQNNVFAFYDELLNVYDGNSNKDYWDNIISRSGGGSGRPIVFNGNAQIFGTSKFNNHPTAKPECKIIYDGITYNITKDYKCVKYPKYNDVEYYGLITGIRTFVLKVNRSI